MAETSGECVLSRLFLNQVACKSQQTALKTANEAVTFAELHARAAAIRDSLVNNVVGRRPVVAVACAPKIAEICAVLAVVLIGGCFVPVDERLPTAYQFDMVDEAEPDAIILSSEVASKPVDSQMGRSENRTKPVLQFAVRRSCLIIELDYYGRLRDYIPTSNPEQGAVAGPPDTTGASSTACQNLLRSRPHSFFAAPGDTTPHVRGSEMKLHWQKQILGRVERPQVGQHGMVDPGFGDTAINDDNNELLYILYTSGTTGTPKGVRGTRSGAINRIHFGWSAFPFRDSGELVCRRTPSCFVDFVAEVFCPLLAGIPLFLPDSGVEADPLRLVPAIAEAKVSRITLTPSLLSSLLRTAGSHPGGLLPDLHTWFVSGEALHPDLARRFKLRTAPGAQLVNLYGSTEVSGDVTYCTLDDLIPTATGEITDDFVDSNFEQGVMIGKALPNVKLSVVDSKLDPVRVGQPGELLVGGALVALGYHRRPHETMKKFLYSSADSSSREGAAVHIPGLAAKSRVFRTGDVVFQAAVDGHFYWLGRLDSEVKVRGVRVSLQEVERLACRAAGFSTDDFAAVWDPGSTRDGGRNARNDSNLTDAPDRGRLIGFFVKNDMHDGDDIVADLRRKLERSMSAAQVPTLLVGVEGFPLTTTGKVDKAALVMRMQFKSAGTRRMEPRNDFGGTVCRDQGLQTVIDEHSRGSTRIPAARAVVAHALCSVLPDSADATTRWAKSPRLAGGELVESRNDSAITFTRLGGTSLMAVEAAWLASVYWQENKSQASTLGTSSSTILEAADFLTGTLDDVASKLAKWEVSSEITVNESPPRINETVRAFAARSHAGAQTFDSTLPVPPPQLQPKLSLPVTFDISGEAPRAARRGIKRRLRQPEAARKNTDQDTDTPCFLAIGRAGAGGLHSSLCRGLTSESAGTKGDIVARGVGFRVRWSADFSKCIDATPLVVIPNCTCPYIDGSQAKAEVVFPSVESVEPLATVRKCCCAQRQQSATGASRIGAICANCVNTVGVFRGSTAYIGSHSGDFQAFKLDTGEREWSFLAGDRMESGACCSSDGSTLFVGCHDRNLYAVNRTTGVVLWSCETNDIVKCTPVSVPVRQRCSSSLVEDEALSGQDLAITSDALLVGSHDGFLRCLRQTDGKVLWMFNCAGALFASPTHDAHARIVYAATTLGRLVAVTRSLRSSDAELLHCGDERGPGGAVAGPPFVLWEQTLPGPCFSTPAVCPDSGSLVVGCVDGGLYCFSSRGEQLWVCRQGQKPIFSSPSLLPMTSDDRFMSTKDETDRPDVAWGCHDGKVRCRLNGRIAWETDIDGGHAIFSSPFFASIGCASCERTVPLVFACSVPGLIAALRLSDGVVVGEARLPGQVFSSPVVVGSMAVLVVGCRDDKVYAMDVRVTCSVCNE